MLDRSVSVLIDISESGPRSPKGWEVAIAPLEEKTVDRREGKCANWGPWDGCSLLKSRGAMAESCQMGM